MVRNLLRKIPCKLFLGGVAVTLHALTAGVLVDGVYFTERNGPEVV